MLTQEKKIYTHKISTIRCNSSRIQISYIFDNFVHKTTLFSCT